jgi:cation diffusion facilitator CzcD-associated flavoprotein CzcO
VAIVGTGSSGIQIAQELSSVVKQLTVFQRTPKMSFPMAQVDYDLPKQAPPESEYPSLFANRVKGFSGLPFDFLPRSTFADTPERRLRTYEELWGEGDFKFLIASYSDVLFTHETIREAYSFWRDKTRARIHCSKVADILAPIEQPYAFGCKRIALERGYFEIYNQPNVSE